MTSGAPARLCALEVDIVYIAASSRDARFTRIAVASVRHFYPDIPIRILPGGRLSPGLLRELRRYWSVELAAVPPGDYGWGFVKLEALFGRPGERFLVLDSDTVMAGPVLRARSADTAPFIVDDERQTEADMRRLYYDWDRVRDIDAEARRPSFTFNSGQWFGTAGLLTRDDFAPWVTWTMPRTLRYPDMFMPGDQGIFNYVLNRKAAHGELHVERRPIMRWPGHGLEQVSARAVRERSAPAVIVHWAGMKRPRWRKMRGADLLQLFERMYFRQIPGGRARLLASVVTETSRQYVRDATAHARLAWRKRIPR